MKTTLDEFWKMEVKDVKISDKEKLHYSLIFLEGKKNKMLNIKIEDSVKIFKIKDIKKIKDIYNKMNIKEKQEKIKNIPHAFVEYGLVDDTNMMMILNEDKIKKVKK